MPTNTTAYTVGDQARIAFTVRSTAGAYVDTRVAVNVLSPSGATSTGYRTSTGGGSTWITRESAGLWHADVDVTEAGRWAYTFRSTGVIVDVVTGAFAARALEAST
jgi:hypothetical protein